VATGDLERSLYRGKRPGRIARAFMRWWAFVAGLGITKDRMVTLEVVGRSSGRTRALPVVLIHVGGERYVASMLGDDVAWVRNVRASGGKATIRAGRRESVVLVEIPPTQRAPMLKEFLRSRRARGPTSRSTRTRRSRPSRPWPPSILSSGSRRTRP